MLGKITEWAANQLDIQGVLLVGSYAQGTANSGSDIDLQFITSDISKWFVNFNWVEEIGKAKKIFTEDWGAVKTVRVFFEAGPEVEFNFAELTWASINPVDPGTKRVISDGAKILYDPNLILKTLIDVIDAQQPS
jgi:predicted nucleotidyltransferase